MFENYQLSLACQYLMKFYLYLTFQLGVSGHDEHICKVYTHFTKMKQLSVISQMMNSAECYSLA